MKANFKLKYSFEYVRQTCPHIVQKMRIQIETLLLLSFKFQLTCQIVYQSGVFYEAAIKFDIYWNCLVKYLTLNSVPVWCGGFHVFEQVDCSPSAIYICLRRNSSNKRWKVEPIKYILPSKKEHVYKEEDNLI